MEGEAHSVWVSSKVLKQHGVTDETPDPIPGLSYYVRQDGHVTGNVFEAATEMSVSTTSFASWTSGGSCRFTLTAAM